MATFLFEFAGSSNALSLLIGSGPPPSKSRSEFGGSRTPPAESPALPAWNTGEGAAMPVL